MKQVLIINAVIDGYTLGQCGESISVGELIEELQRYDSNLPVYVSHDAGYSYGVITAGRIRKRSFEEEEFQR